jgi:hypothetical protein
MQNTLKLVAAAAALAAASLAHADVSIGANIEYDITKAKGADIGQSGRVEIGVNGSAKNGMGFVAGRAAIETQVNGNANNVADVWVQFGNDSADLKLGRFEAEDLGPVGKDTVVSARVGGYNGNMLRGRVSTGQTHAALGLNASSALRLEVGLVTDNSTNNYGFRPVVKYTSGAMSLKVGIEGIKTAAGGSQTGVAANLGYDLGGGTNVGLSIGNNSKADLSTVAAYVNSGAFGAGLIHDDNAGATSNTFFAAYTLPLLGVKGASVTPAFSYSNWSNGATDNAFRVRFNYAF